MRSATREQCHRSHHDADASPAHAARACAPLAHVLVVDDELVVRELVKHFLELEGYAVTCAEDGVDGVTRFRDEPGRFRIVILDLLMPRMGGRDAFYELRRTDPNLPILVMSAYAPQEQAADVIGQRLSAFLHKPFILGDLLLRVQDLLAESAREADAWDRRASAEPYRELEL